MSRQSNNKIIDNTPFWAVDPDKWDLSYMSFHGKEGEVTFDPRSTETRSSKPTPTPACLWTSDASSWKSGAGWGISWTTGM
jgi:hypothetical protein